MNARQNNLLLNNFNTGLLMRYRRVEERRLFGAMDEAWEYSVDGDNSYHLPTVQQRRDGLRTRCLMPGADLVLCITHQRPIAVLMEDYT